MYSGELLTGPENDGYFRDPTLTIIPGIPVPEQRQLWAAHEGARLRKFPLEPQHWELAASVDIVGEQACDMLAWASGHTTSRLRSKPGACAYKSLIMQQLLQRNDAIATQFMEYPVEGEYHYFLQSTEVSDETFDFDGTWQQFLARSTDLSQQPHVLILPASKHAAAVRAHDAIPIGYSHIWRASRPRPIDYRQLEYEPLNRIFRTMGWAHSS